MIVVVSNIPGHALQPNLPPRPVITLQNCVPERSCDPDGRVQRHKMRGVVGRHQRVDLGVTAGLLRDQNRVAPRLDPRVADAPGVSSRAISASVILAGCDISKAGPEPPQPPPPPPPGATTTTYQITHTPPSPVH